MDRGPGLTRAVVFPIERGMYEQEDRSQRVQVSVTRLLVLAAVGGSMVLMANFMRPEQTRAMPSLRSGLEVLRPAPKIPPDAARPPSRSPRGGLLLGEMVGRENRIWVYGEGAEVRYTVCTLQGDVLMADMEADEVYRLFPHLDLMGMHLDPTPRVAEDQSGVSGGPLMIADTEPETGR